MNEAQFSSWDPTAATNAIMPLCAEGGSPLTV